MRLGTLLRASETKVMSLLGRNPSQYQVPLYQRTFSWKEENLDRLWEDILIQAEVVESGSHTVPLHFLGAVVLAPSPSNQASRSTYIIVDGQQRFTALTLAMAAIRDQLLALGKDERAVDRINDYFLTNRHGTGDDQLRLLPTQTDRDSYRVIILGHEPRDIDQHSASAIKRTYDYFVKKINDAEADPDSSPLELIERAVGERLALVEITVDDSENPHAIFESLNNTGLQLSQADLVRNFLFMKLEDKADSIYEKYWLPLQNRLSMTEPGAAKSEADDSKLAARLSRLLWMQLILAGENETRMEDLYRAKTRWLHRDGLTTAKLRAYVQDVYRRSALYQRMLQPAREPHLEVRRRLERLSRWGALVADPTILFLLDRREQGGIDDHALAQGLRIIESFLVRRMLVGRQTQGLNKIFQRLPSIGDGQDPVQQLHAELSRERLGWITDDELRELFRERRFYETGNSSQRRFVLQSLEEAFEHPEPVDLTNRGLTVEHVLPQKPAPEWWEILREDAKPLNPPLSQSQLHDQLVHLIGNLTLSAENSRLSNHPFERKKQILDRSHLEMNLEIAGTERWGREAILDRCDRLADLAVKVWPGPLR
jgi:hypothetical protein